MKVQIVFAHSISTSHNAPFGNKQSLPWKHNSTDLKHFKSVTDGTVLLMGSKTFESLPMKLPNRPHIVLSSGDSSKAKNGDVADLYLNCSMSEAIEAIRVDYGKYRAISVIGGPSVILSAIDYADVIYKSIIFQPDVEFDVTIDLFKLCVNFPITCNIGGDDTVSFVKLTRTSQEKHVV
jgi:dihydrofolate reductase